jgi:wyosine [tRNA(Phe)-imidazoG37] synthetase (radical SAM superfamily)
MLKQINKLMNEITPNQLEVNGIMSVSSIDTQQTITDINNFEQEITLENIMLRENHYLSFLKRKIETVKTINEINANYGTH